MFFLKELAEEQKKNVMPLPKREFSICVLREKDQVLLKPKKKVRGLIQQKVRIESSSGSSKQAEEGEEEVCAPQVFSSF